MKKTILLHLYFFALLLFPFENLTAQNGIDKIIDLRTEQKPMVQVLYDLSLSQDIKFFFVPGSLPYYPITNSFEKKAIFHIIKTITDGTKLLAIPYQDKGVCLIDREQATPEFLADLVAKWEDGTYDYPFDKNSIEHNYTFGDSASAKTTARLSIQLKDDQQKEPITGAVISNADLSINGVSDANGNIVLQVPTGYYELNCNYIGYQSNLLKVTIYEDANIDLTMAVQTFLFDEIEVVANSMEQQLKNSESGKEVINIKKLDAIPQVMGEVDIIKSLEILPGVTSAGELSIGFNVRGGSIDESLVLLNDGMIFNPTHIVGFISAFNADALDQATLYKAYVDPEYGTRGSAILDLKSDASNVKGWKGKGGIGTSMLKLYLEGPISDKLTFHVAGRGSFNDYMLRAIANAEIQRSNARFFDINTSLCYKINDDQKIILNNYSSQDYFEYNDEFGFEWANQHSGLQWKSNWTEKLFSSLSLNYGSYDSDNFTVNISDASHFKSGLYYWKGLTSVSRKMGAEGFVKVGVEYINYFTKKDRLEPSEGSTLNPVSIQRKSAVSISPFLTFNQKITEQLNFEAGIRYATYLSKGPGTLYSYSSERKDPETIESTAELDGNDPEGTYRILEPRASLNYNFASNWSVKAAYNRMSQNLLQLSSTNTTLPTDFWVFSDRHLQPLIVDQYSLGAINQFRQKSFSIGLDVFYKQMQQLYELQDFGTLLLNEHLETELIESKGKSYGVEVLLQKQTGRWKGSTAYTYNRTFRQTVDPNKSINRGDVFPANFDIPHQLNILASFQWLPVVSFNFAYVFKSGKPTTVPSASIIQDGILTPVYSDKNKERIPYYSRFDFSINMDFRQAKEKGFRGSLTFGIYNLLGRNNANNVFFRRSARGNVVPFQFSVVGSPIPTLSWNFVF
jgi:CarboxypepD_reg-like domain